MITILKELMVCCSIGTSVMEKSLSTGALDLEYVSICMLVWTTLENDYRIVEN